MNPTIPHHPVLLRAVTLWFGMAFVGFGAFLIMMMFGV
jgi:hypothetical protein